jgi:hypothetical protein
MNFPSLSRLTFGMSLFSAYPMASPPAVSYHFIKKGLLAATPGEHFD